MAILVNSSTDVLSSTTWLPSTSAVTVVGWWYFTDDPNTNYARCVELLGSGTDFARMSYDYSANSIVLAYQTAGTLWNYMEYAFAPGTGTWFAFAWTCDDSNHYVYYGTDPASLTSQTGGISGSSIAFTATAMHIAANPTADRYLRGRASGVKVFDAILTSGEVAAELQRLTQVRTANLNRCYPFLGSTIAEAVRDYGPNGYTLSATSIDIADGPSVPWGVAVLSTPGVQDITATSARPKVTLTYA